MYAVGDDADSPPDPRTWRFDGMAWTRLNPALSCDVIILEDLWVSGPGEVLVVGDAGTIGRSSDAGQSWTSQCLSPGTDRLSGVWADGQGGIYAVGSSIDCPVLDCPGNQGIAARSLDGGSTWERTVVGAGMSLARVWGAGPNDILAVGSDGTAGIILRSKDQGATWNPVGVGSAVLQQPLRGIWGSAAGDVYVVGDGGTFHTTDGGATWKKVDPRPSTAVWGGDTGDVIVGMTVGSSALKALLGRSTNGGATWATVPAGDGPVSSIWGTSKQGFVLSGEQVLHFVE